jgi:hypothetical protein
LDLNNLGEIKTEFENILRYESEAQMGLYDEKTRVKKFHDTVFSSNIFPGPLFHSPKCFCT